MELDKKIGQELKSLRDKKGYSTREVGRRIGVSNSYVSKIENGQTPSLETLKKLCDVYDVELVNLFGKAQETPEELKSLGVDWIAFVNEMRGENLTPEEIKKYIDAVKVLKGLT